MKNFITNNCNPNGLKTAIRKTCFLTLLLSITSSLPASAVAFKEMKQEFKDLTFDLNGIRSDIKGKVELLSDTSYSMAFCLDMCQKTTILKDIKTMEEKLSDRVAKTSLPNSYKLEMQKKLVERLFRPIYEHVMPLADSFNQAVAEIKSIALEKQASSVDYNTENLRNKLNSFSSETLLEIFPKNSEACKDFLIPDIEEVKVIPERTRQTLKDIQERVGELKSVMINGLPKKMIVGRDNKEYIYGNGEEIMFYGQVFAPEFLPSLTQQLPQILNFTGDKNSLTKLSEIQEFYNKLKKENVIQLDSQQIELQTKELQLRKALEQTEYRTISSTGINPKATLLETFYILQHLYNRDFENSARKDDIKSLVTTSYIRLSDQNQSCVTGLIGRTFLIYRDLFQYAVEHY